MMDLMNMVGTDMAIDNTVKFEKLHVISDTSV